MVVLKQCGIPIFFFSRLKICFYGNVYFIIIGGDKQFLPKDRRFLSILKNGLVLLVVVSREFL